ncbi:hypothetical protein N7481_005565 [Penicillium waksmanii]|uniref:uncharacterized protein n=1 Tax=Penicillium waksmanii TaxID=69791 RepID=UPI002548DB59|nr:uncharacterized protein N7481_005565 [Penicillium waksmanii]KAJ5983466.1 hypothetical protein N7481_005565 [Penicillium waksmanii]
MVRRSRSRRTHLLGACATCQRRHVKCDQQRPACKTCSASGYTCEGFSSDVRWMQETGQSPTYEKSSAKGNPLKRNGLRRHLYSEQSRVSMGAVLNKGLFSGSIDSTIEEIDARSCGPSASPFKDIRIGPFAVLNFSDVDQEVPDLPSAITEPPTDSVLPVRGSQLPAELAEFTDDSDLLQWSDIFGLNDDLCGITSNFPLNLMSYPDFSAHPDWLTYDDTTCNLSSPTMLDSTTEIFQMPPGHLGQDFMSIPQILPTTTTPTTTTTTTTTNPTTPVDILGDAPFLLHIFQKHVVPQLTIVPFGKKASWNIMNLPAALITLGDLTILESQEVSHARQANLYSLLTCAAVFLAKKPSTDSDGDNQLTHWHQVASKSYHEAKDHTLIFMKEPLGAPKTKYKDRTMAMCGMIEAANFNGQQQDARYFILEAERLLRRRGIYKPRTSHKSRLLVNVYTWLRIVGESTYVLQDFTASKQFIDALNYQIQTCRPENMKRPSQSASDRITHHDDFLHMEHSDNDLDIDSPKDSRKDIPDIHLHDSRKSAATLAKQVYGISETWLSLVSQTTRLANVLEKVKAAQNADMQMDSKISRFLQERSDRLESVIHSYIGPSDQSSSLAEPPDAYAHVFQAFNAGLVILFYRRVRKVHPGILSGQVDIVIRSLQALHAELPTVDHTGPGTIWPVFMAGCEAMTNDKRNAILELLEKSDQNCRLPPFQTARCVMTSLWEKYDKEPLYSWMDILKEHRAWPMFC